ncbi:hypothetical protein XCR1_1060036 [Xenorhabdus cabanillasii JM26]|uniref:Uncharacterized protein n=1 Tax=Xenorhabdus cabanillasii JM26 TaxID=1427517 RepID=W1IPM3_9GAMM|nr:hypothetical protein XCR1_1060036 [Xenorhabdus cabanillasii JM26]
MRPVSISIISQETGFPYEMGILSTIFLFWLRYVRERIQ